jgi:GxxExxY protein
LLESAYEECLCHELHLRGRSFRRQVDVDDAVVLELKCVEKIVPIYEAQLLTYLKISGKHVGLLINFNVPLLTQGIIRRVL